MANALYLRRFPPSYSSASLFLFMVSSLRLSLAALLLLFVAGVPGLSSAQDGDQPIVATDLYQLKDLGSVTASPDGRKVAYTVRSIEKTDDGYTYRSHLHLVRAARGEAPQQLTHGAQEASQPAWHPDGDRLAFVRTVDDTPQIFILPVFGGEAYQLTEFEHGASSPQWSPNGRQLLFSSSLSKDGVREVMGNDHPEWPLERAGFDPTAPVDEDITPNPDGSLEEVQAYLKKTAAESNPRLLHRLNFQGEFDLLPEPSFQHFFVLDMDEEDATPQPVTRGFYSFGSADWLPNNRQIVVSGAVVDDTHPDRVDQNRLYLVSLNQLQPRLLLEIEEHSLSNPQVSPDGRTVLFQASDLRNRGYAQTQLGLFNLSGREAPDILSSNFDRSLGSPRWSRDNWAVYFTAPADGGFPLYRLSLIDEDEDGQAGIVRGLRPAGELSGDSRSSFEVDEIGTPNPAIERLTSFERGIRSYDITDATVYFVATDVSNPFELFSANRRVSEEEQLTRHNADWIADRQLSFPQMHMVESDTFDVQYWVMPPAGFDPDTDSGSFPVMLQIHGGPSAMWGPGEVSMWHEFQLMAARGFGVVYSNPRGSGGYGNDFRRANFQDWGDGPTADVLAALDDALERYDWLDGSQQVVTGGSYAGYLTAWIIAHTDRFDAAVAQRGVYDLPTFLGEGNAWRLVPNHFGGFPWDTERPDPPEVDEENEDEQPSLSPADTMSVREILEYNSPMTHVANITTPFLIKHGDNDLRTGVIQSEMLYKSLKILERPVEYIRYPGAGHDMSRTGDPEQRVDRLLRIYEFMARYVDLTGAPLFIETTEPEPIDVEELFQVETIEAPDEDAADEPAENNGTAAEMRTAQPLVVPAS